MDMEIYILQAILEVLQVLPLQEHIRLLLMLEIFMLFWLSSVHQVRNTGPLFFGMLRDIVGMSREDVEFPEGADLRSVFASYAARFPRLGDLARSIVVARNQEFTDPAAKLAEGDEVAFLPPVSGGCDAGNREIAEAGHYFALTHRPIDTRRPN